MYVIACDLFELCEILIRAHLHPDLHSLLGLVRLLAQQLHIRLTRVCPREVRLELDALVTVLQGGPKIHNLDIGLAAVAVQQVVDGVSLDALGVALDRLNPLALLEILVTLCALLLGLDWRSGGDEGSGEEGDKCQ